MREASTQELYRQAGFAFQQYVAENMIASSAASVPFLQAIRTNVKGYEHLHGYKILFETTWVDRP
jgi:hypothetical protein